jgi:N-acetylglucosaminyldiphosphoundecaprenol N-acetyl-beta-D-mannosaminyltransferase
MQKLEEKPEIKVLGISLFASNLEHLTRLVLHKCTSSKRSNLCISATGAHGLVFAQQNDLFKQTLESFYLNAPDGMPGVWIGRMKGARNMRRCYGPDVFKEIVIQSRKTNITHFFCGGNEGVADELKQAVKNKFSNEQIAGTYCPPFLSVEKYDYAAIAKRIDEVKPNIVWIGLSTPKQEIFASNLSRFTNVNFIITVGAAFDFHTDRVKQAPTLLQRVGLEWLFRLLMEPRRLYKRYFEVVPLFIYYNLRELLTFAFLKR